MAETRRALFKTSILSALGLLSLGSAGRATASPQLTGDQCDLDALVSPIPVLVHTYDPKGSLILVPTGSGGFIAFNGPASLSDPKPDPDQLLKAILQKEAPVPTTAKSVTVNVKTGSKPSLSITNSFVKQSDIDNLSKIHTAGVGVVFSAPSMHAKTASSGGRWNEIGNS